MSSGNESTPSQATIETTATSPAKVKEYPEPLASHEDVVKDLSLFWDTLRRFHSILATKFM